MILSFRSCVYTMGSPINNRALFPCQEPPVAMSTWQARVHAPSECTALLSGENEAHPVPEENGTNCLSLNECLSERVVGFSISEIHLAFGVGGACGCVAL